MGQASEAGLHGVVWLLIGRSIVFFSAVSMGRQVRAWRPIVFLVLLISLPITACSSFGASRPPGPSPHRGVLLRDEIWKSNAHQGDVLQAIRSLRPEYLVRPRGAITSRSPAAVPLAVYIEGVRQGSIESLHNISASRVAEIRYLDPTAAMSVYGPVAGGGAVLIKVFDEKRPPIEP